jgi:AmmeMemoRadiSam system protein A
MNHGSTERGDLLISLARAAIASRFGLWFSVDEQAEFLAQPAASFVTLKLAGQLRGCIGSLQAHRSLGEDVKANAQAAAFQDPRFEPLSANEFGGTRIEVSVLSPLAPIAFDGETQALSALRRGADGVVLAWRDKRATFLPQVWETLPEPRNFLGELKRKAGLAADFWADDIRLYRYDVDVWTETA